MPSVCPRQEGDAWLQSRLEGAPLLQWGDTSPGRRLPGVHCTWSSGVALGACGLAKRGLPSLFGISLGSKVRKSLPSKRPLGCPSGLPQGNVDGKGKKGQSEDYGSPGRGKEASCQPSQDETEDSTDELVAMPFHWPFCPRTRWGPTGSRSRVDSPMYPTRNV